MLKIPIYLDNQATTPCDPRVVEAMLPFFHEQFGNAASHTHSYGWHAAESVKQAREQLATLIGADPTEIIFTSGATESDNLGLKGVFERYRQKGNHIITCVTEHKAVLDTCAHIAELGGRLTLLPVDKQGLINLQQLEKAIGEDTILICLMYANNETGVIQPVREISRIARSQGVLFMSDATQAIGKIQVDVNKDGIDLMAFSAHKIYGPKGTGALYVRRRDPRVSLKSQMDGGGHENGLRSGTLNVPGIVGFGKACELCAQEMVTDTQRLQPLRDQLECALLEMDEVYMNGSRNHRLPTVSNLAFGGLDGNQLMTELVKELAVSSGSACTSALPLPSHVLKAMGLPDALAKASIRFSLGRFTSAEEIAFAVEKIKYIVSRLRLPA